MEHVRSDGKKKAAAGIMETSRAILAAAPDSRDPAEMYRRAAELEKLAFRTAAG